MKKLVTKRNVNDYLIEGEDKFYADGSTIITPGAKDILRNNGIVIVYGERVEKCVSEAKDCREEKDLEKNEEKENELQIVRTITNLLTQEFNISDSDRIKEITSKVLSIINK